MTFLILSLRVNAHTVNFTLNYYDSDYVRYRRRDTFASNLQTVRMCLHWGSQGSIDFKWHSVTSQIYKATSAFSRFIATSRPRVHSMIRYETNEEIIAKIPDHKNLEPNSLPRTIENPTTESTLFYAAVTMTNIYPSKETAIIAGSITEATDYACAIGKIIEEQAIRFISQISNVYVCISIVNRPHTNSYHNMLQ